MDNGWRLSEGIRRRISLGRALTTNGMLAVIDEPTESLDGEGCKAVHQILGAMAKQGKTIIVMSHDKNIVKGPHLLLDLNVKPTPSVTKIGYETVASSAEAPVSAPASSPTQAPAPTQPPPATAPAPESTQAPAPAQVPASKAKAKKAKAKKPPPKPSDKSDHELSLSAIQSRYGIDGEAPNGPRKPKPRGRKKAVGDT